MQAAALGDEETPAWAQNFNLAEIAKEGCNAAKNRLGFEQLTKNSFTNLDILLFTNLDILLVSCWRKLYYSVYHPFVCRVLR